MSPLAFIEADFAKIIGCTPSPNRPDPLPETPAQPEHSTDSTGVITGNDDIATPDGWRQWDGPQERAPLPVYPNPEQTYVDCAARLARVDAHFDGLESLARSIISKDQAELVAREVHGRMRADGLLSDRRQEVRA